ncbi:hypothetical protein [Paracoccus tibetensis]|uniref:Cell division protein ZapB n=1 Tax=Paracoccus tibetensis TaxID=336292 RepID=A0A1G5G5N7_9RHOB|nr:hypothetical protein [Paracoccus tibetensis]SCY46835.1 hypothetical protein SAMN05660710_01618 [Paracoccus tibetensis]
MSKRYSFTTEALSPFRRLLEQLQTAVGLHSDRIKNLESRNEELEAQIRQMLPRLERVEQENRDLRRISGILRGSLSSSGD